MALQAGTRLGPYEIVSLIGSGGMGEVYRARDTRLDRSVAVKVLAPELASDAEFRARFAGEAKAISALNHAHICALFDIGHQDGIHFLVMEYLDGETLARRLARGRFPLAQAVQNGIQIADALAAAHKAGIIHRDVKPGNVLLTRSGLKLLDFGLAKAAPPILRRPAETELATDAHLTGEGALVGTVEYMAPEQLEGKELDPRTDIFALGALLYEMVTGRKAFIGETQASLITAIMSSEPARLVSVAPMTPPLLDRLIHACLAKNPDDRVQTAQDVLLQLRWMAESSQAGPAAAVLPQRRRLRERAPIAWTAFAMAMVVAVGAVWFALPRDRSPSDAAKVVRSTILLPERVMLNNAVISPDGDRIVFSGRDRTGRSQLWLRRLEAEDATPLAGTEGGLLPFWSPDGHHIGFFVASPVKALRRVDASGGAPLSLYDVDGVGGAWTPNDDILFSAASGPILRIPAAGGHATPVTTLEASRGETAHRYPFLLPDGRHFLYLAMRPGGSRRDPANRIWVGSLDGGQAKPLISSSFNAQYANNHLLFIRGGDFGGSLLAQPFDPVRLETRNGGPVTVAEHVAVYWEYAGLGSVSVAQTGTILFDGSRLLSRVEWYDRAGRQTGTFGEPAVRTVPRLSPDGSRIGFNKYDAVTGTTQVWVADVPRGVETRLTSPPGSNQAPVWAPDGTRLAYTSDAKHQGDIQIRLADGSGTVAAVTDEPGQRAAMDWSSDGRVVIAFDREPAGERLVGISAFPLDSERRPFTVVPRRARNIAGVSLSMDRRWLAYDTDEGGPREVYVVSFPDGGHRVQISNAGGFAPKWTRNGHELLYRTHNEQVMSVSVDTTHGLRAGTPTPLFVVPEGADSAWDVSADGQRFVFTVPVLKSSSVPLSLVLNWAADKR